MAGDLLNDHIHEKISRAPKAHSSNDVRNDARASTQHGNDQATRQANIDTLNRLNAYFEVQDRQAVDGEAGDEHEAWLESSEFPSELEVGSLLNGKWTAQQLSVDANNLTYPYDSVNDYLQLHYKLLNEDIVSTLREAVEDASNSPHQTESQSLAKTRLYNRVYITGLTIANEGIAHHLEIHTDRSERRISWAQSKRLKPGTLVAVTPAQPRDELFKHRCLIGTVAARPLAELESDKPTIYVYFTEPSMMDIDPQCEYFMVEAACGYFEAVRHTMLALQHIRHEKFPLAKHLVFCETIVDYPDSLKEDPYLDISAALTGDVKWNVDVVEGWPEVQYINSSKTNCTAGTLATTLDESQFEALKRILTKRLAIVQGPPGTGKTHVSVIALKIFLENRKVTDPPIIVTAQTNHALDQLLRHIAPHASDFIRMGGQTTDQDIIAPRTLFNVKEAAGKTAHNQLRRSRHTAQQALTSVAKQIRDLLAPLITDEAIDPKAFLDHDLITDNQYKSLVEAKASWVGDVAEGADTPIGRWAEGHVRMFEKAVPERAVEEEALEDDDEDLYKLNDIELETGAVEDDKDSLFGEKILFSAGFQADRGLSDKSVETLLARHQDLNDIAVRHRGPIYDYLQKKLKARLLPDFRKLAAQVKRAVRRLKIARAHLDAAFLREAPLIGVTTTGLSKYRGVLSSLMPKIVVIEEAAETLEGYVTAACFESLDRLILVGDHAQLRAHTQNPEMEQWNLQISLFERLVTYHNVEFKQLTTQRRMLPEMREVMNIIYPALADHPCVSGRPDIPGMNSVNSWFMSHQTTESADEQFSWVNREEAELIVGLFKYLARNGTEPENITVLTFYRGQQRMLRHLMRQSLPYYSHKIKVSTVDAYQGEENEVVILSLVRNNERESIGFLDVVNRVCVAMSRARRGFYIFGNAQLLVAKNLYWKRMLRLMRKNGRVGSYLPIVCTRHGRLVKIHASTGWDNCDGGCDHQCRQKLECGHTCHSYCHPESHDSLLCIEECKKKLPCGHYCAQRCCDACKCRDCEVEARKCRREMFNYLAGDKGLFDETGQNDEAKARNLGVNDGIVAQPGTASADELITLAPWQNTSKEADKSSTPDDKVISAASKDYGRPVKDGWMDAANGSKAPQQIPNIGGLSRAEQKLSVKAYQQYAQGGVLAEDKRRADASATAAAAAAAKVKEMGGDASSGPIFGGLMPMRLAQSRVEDISPVKRGQSKIAKTAIGQEASQPRLNTTSRQAPLINFGSHQEHQGPGRSAIEHNRNIMGPSEGTTGNYLSQYPALSASSPMNGKAKRADNVQSLIDAPLQATVEPKADGHQGGCQIDKTPPPGVRRKWVDTWMADVSAPEEAASLSMRGPVAGAQKSSLVKGKGKDGR